VAFPRAQYGRCMPESMVVVAMRVAGEPLVARNILALMIEMPRVVHGGRSLQRRSCRTQNPQCRVQNPGCRQCSCRLVSLLSCNIEEVQRTPALCAQSKMVKKMDDAEKRQKMRGKRLSRTGCVFLRTTTADYFLNFAVVWTKFMQGISAAKRGHFCPKYNYRCAFIPR